MLRSASGPAGCIWPAGAPTQKLPRPGSVRSFPDASKSDSASRTEVLLTPNSEESSRCDGNRASGREAIISSIRVATLFESVFQFSICIPGRRRVVDDYRHNHGLDKLV